MKKNIIIVIVTILLFVGLIVVYQKTTKLIPRRPNDLQERVTPQPLPKEQTTTAPTTPTTTSFNTDDNLDEALQYIEELDKL